jgi:hydroxyethylthiazole kinase-like uncharacterized protein yjeF
MSGRAFILRIEALRAIEAADAEHGLMERAGAAGAALAEKICKPGGRPILILAGPGNNGGDALVVARRLHERTIACHLVLAGDEAHLPADAKKAWEKFLAAGGTVHRDFPPEERWDLVIDGLFGVGLTRNIDGHYAVMIGRVQNAAQQSGCPLLALDCPSGLDADTGSQRGATIVATHTISFLGLKPGLLTADGPDCCGEITVADLDATWPVLPAAAGGHLVGPAEFRSVLQARPRNSHKGSFGAAGILGGAPGMVGAALLAGRAALKLGAGRVYLGFPGDPPLLVDPGQPELMLRDADDFFAAPLTALACGPGLGQSAAARMLLDRAIAAPLPLVIDADALNLLASEPMLGDLVAQRSAPTVLTPHPGEAARLLESRIEQIQADRLAAACLLAARYRSWVILKGCGSIVVSPDGNWWINRTGNAGLASAGSGDVLSGMLAALLAGGGNPGHAVLAATWLHGAAADALVGAQPAAGPVGLTASELPNAARLLLNQLIKQTATNE